MNTYQGQQTHITCNYPAEYKRNYKYILKLGIDSFKGILDTEAQSQNGRFSVSDDRSGKVLSMHISDVREADDGVYLCGVQNIGRSVVYYSYFTEIQLHVRGETFIHVVLKMYENLHWHLINTKYVWFTGQYESNI